MEKLNYQQIAALIDEMAGNDIDISEEQWMHTNVPLSIDRLDDFDPARLKEIYTLFGKIELVDQHGGEGEGDSYWTIYHFVDHDVYIQFDGWYASYVGAEFNEKFEVRPEQVMVTQYRQVK